MRKTILHTTTFFFPDYPTFPKIKPPISSLKQGPDGVFGIAMSTAFEGENSDEYEVPCFFLEIDLDKMKVTERSEAFSYRDLSSLQIGYDAANKIWIATMSAMVRENVYMSHLTVLDLYEIPSAVHDSWLRILRLEEANNECHYLVACWQQGKSFPLVFTGSIGDDGLSETCLLWTQWRSSDIMGSEKNRLLGKCFLWKPCIFGETFLLFTGEYQRRSGHWRFRISAYDNNGTRLSSKLVPDVSFPNRHTGFYIADDLWDWLWPTICLTQGPPFGKEGRPTCVAVLLFKEQLELSRAWNKGRLPRIDHGLPSVQGGLYWVDDHGRILQHESSLLGEQISLCRCGETIVGTDLLEGQRRLWSWSPVDGRERMIKTTLSTDTERITLVSAEGKQQGATFLFWCIEEYAQGMRVSLWNAETYREMHHEWSAGLWLGDHLSGPGNYREPCAVAYQGTLLIVGITQERRFQVVQFRCDD